MKSSSKIQLVQLLFLLGGSSENSLHWQGHQQTGAKSAPNEQKIYEPATKVQKLEEILPLDESNDGSMKPGKS